MDTKNPAETAGYSDSCGITVAIAINNTATVGFPQAWAALKKTDRFLTQSLCDERSEPSP